MLAQAVLALACLPYEAAYTLDAVLRTLGRMWFTRRGLLEWQPSATLLLGSPASPLADLRQTLRRMAVAPVLALVTFAGLAAWRPGAVPVALPVLALWLFSPVFVWFTSRPLRPRRSVLDAEQAAELRRLARRTWAFFEAYVTREDNHLPPDNMQEHPVERIAHRTSPTNIGLSLLANLAAHDFGYLTVGQLLQRTLDTLDSMERLEKHEGHWLNWYDTQTLRPLRPAYVSSVDSGNLAGHLLVLRGGLLLLAEEPPKLRALFAGLADTVALLREVLRDDRRAAAAAGFAATLEHCVREAPEEPAALFAAFHALLERARLVHASLDTGADPSSPRMSARAPLEAETDESHRWAGALVAQCAAALAEVVELAPAAATDPSAKWDDTALQARTSRLRALGERAGAMAQLDYGFLFDAGRRLLFIGYNVDDRRRDSGHYDLLASEVRLTSFVAIAQGQLPQESWFALGRQLATVDRHKVLLSWSGSMFEYLMPMLVMPSYEQTLLDETANGAVERQIRYGQQRGVPWGMSESGYYITDAHLNYQYRAFGVPGLGLKRGLAQDLVVAPYATVLAAMVDPLAALHNLRRLAREGASGTFGYHEAIDYTASRLPRGESRAVVRSYMAHHQGMSLLALDYVLCDRPMQRRFESDPRLKATSLLLQERVPKAVAYRHHAIAEGSEIRSAASGGEMPARLITTADTLAPEVQLLSNGRYHVMLTNAGGGSSRWKDVAVSRWREDGTTDEWGNFCYLRDTETGTFWSTTHQPTHWRPDHYEAIFSEGRAEFRRRDQGIDAYTEVVVSPEDDIELRRTRLTNLSRTRRSIEVTSYSEIVLAPAAADAQHPAFGKLFVQTEIVDEPPAIFATRRPRSADEQTPWMCHVVAVHGAAAGAASHETDRARFIGRGRSLHAPAALRQAVPLSGSGGSVLDPIAATRRVVTLEPEQTAIVDLVYGAAETRDACLGLVQKYMDRRLADRVFELAWTHSQVILRQLNATEAETQLYAQLANLVVHSQPALRAEARVLLQNRRSQSGLWGYAISGDLPIVLVQISEAAHIELARQLVQAHAWWRLKGLAVDLVIWNEERDVYRQRLQEQMLGMIAGSTESHVVDRPGGIFVRQAEQIAPEDRTLLQAVARAVLSDRLGSLAEQLRRKRPLERRPPPFAPTRSPETWPAATMDARTRNLLFFNGTGGYAPDGREYVIAPTDDRRPPAPWANVIANPRFGTVVSEAGSSYTWCENAHELRLTPWHNDPVVDPSGEVIYLRDEETGQVWHPTSLPMLGDVRDEGRRPPYLTRHGFGYSVFDHVRAGIRSELTVFVALDAAVKFSRLVVRNESSRARKLSTTGYVEWVLGDMRAKTAPHIQTEISAASGAIFARNRYSNDFGDWVAYYTVDESDRLFSTLTGDRAEFIGRNGTLHRPAALRRAGLSGRVGVGLDPCAAIQVPFELEAGQSCEITFRLGMGRSHDEAGELVQRFRGAAAVREALAAVKSHWDDVLGTVRISTPDPSIDLLANGWLVYQTLACRVWARSGYYQSGGAWGFRDQLQDAMALVHARPQVLRDQLLLCAGRQFVEGDVQHWWHPPSGRGVRTHISDDYLWLPLALCRYIDATHDLSVLDEEVPFLDGRPVPPSDESYYDLPSRAVESASVYQHAVQAVLHGLRFGAHGLPLMGAGDWNDGMNRVGNAGRGESVWLGFFLCEVLEQFARLSHRRGDHAFAQRCQAERRALATRIEATAWDGEWYRRAYFDDGTALGSSANAECRIDSIAQSWSVMSGVAPRERARRAMASLGQRLVRDDARLVQLLDPPFDRRGPNPGYIAGYAPGVRENGGQYTHGAIWAAMAYASLGDAEGAWRVMDLINPIRHGRTADEVDVYKVEPYAVAADVYSVAPHTGRGGWSWYTGSAGWMYRLVLESLLGLRLCTDEDGAWLELTPCVPASWPGFRIDYRHGRARYAIDVTVSAAHGASTMEVDGLPVQGLRMRLADDGHEHNVRVSAAWAPALARPEPQDAARN